ncbi:MAG: prolyl oligopeptidase family serine peptidase [Streptosporangiales bacterium]|nr:prolyl oligopeptidase family serine peptidase [Streptosporangiales bacterium]
MAVDLRSELAFTYFPDDYRWSHGLLIALNAAPWGGAEIGEVHRVGMRLRDRVGDDEEWFRAWSEMASSVAERGHELLAGGRRRSAASYLLRAANYFHVGERFRQPKTATSDAAYRQGVECFRDAAAFLDRPAIEPVEIPYEGTTLPALLVHAERRGATPAPGMVYFDGFDITKEIQYFKGAAELAARGISCLIVDGPGNGEAIRFRGLPLHHETERYATAAYEWLAARPEVDEARIGVMGISLGGYYAPRAAAFEQRFACCVAWGAQWDYHARWSERLAQLDGGDTPSLSVPWQHLLWVLGVNSREDALDALAGFRLDGVVQRIRCPFLLLHGEGDEQIPLPDAQRCYDAVGSAHKTLRVFTRDEGGYHHCQIDNVSIAVAELGDWLDDVLRPG